MFVFPPHTLKQLCKALYFFNNSPFLPDSIMNKKGPDRVILRRNVSALSKHTVAPRHELLFIVCYNRSFFIGI